MKNWTVAPSSGSYFGLTRQQLEVNKLAITVLPGQHDLFYLSSQDECTAPDLPQVRIRPGHFESTTSGYSRVDRDTLGSSARNGCRTVPTSRAIASTIRLLSSLHASSFHRPVILIPPLPPRSFSSSFPSRVPGFLSRSFSLRLLSRLTPQIRTYCYAKDQTARNQWIAVLRRMPGVEVCAEDDAGRRILSFD